MVKENVDSINKFKLEIEKFTTLFGWGLFILFLLLPIFIIIGLLTSLTIVFIWMVIFWIVAFIFIMLYRNIMKAKFMFWVDKKILISTLDSYYYLYSGAISSGLLFWGLIASLSNNFYLLIYAVIYLIVLIPPFIIAHLIIIKKKRNSKNTKIRFFQKKYEEVAQIILKVLEDLDMKYEVTKGSEWTGKKPEYIIKKIHSRITVGDLVNEVSISIKFKNSKNISKIKEIEKKIDYYMMK